MNARILTIAAAAIAVTAVGVTTPASATSLGAAGQTIAQGFDSPIVEVSKKHGKRHGKRWHGKRWHGRHHGHKGFYYGHYAPYGYGGCFKQVQALVGGYYVWTTVNICN